jgi:hypothetical protein
VIGGTFSFPLYAAPPGDPTYDFEIPEPIYGGFHFDLSVGQASERELFGDLFSPDGRPVKLEVKTDFKCQKTGRVAVEFEKRTFDGRTVPSGIKVTQADHYVFVISRRTRLFIPTEELKQLGRRAYRAGMHRWIGDGERFHNVLIPIQWFASEAGS